MGWILQGVFPLQPYPSEQWIVINAPGSYPDGIWGFTLAYPPSGYPVNWNYLGNWHWGEFVEGVGTLGPKRQLPNFYVPGLPVLNVITPEDAPRVPGASSGQFLFIHVFRWVLVREVILWVYDP